MKNIFGCWKPWPPSTFRPAWKSIPHQRASMLGWISFMKLNQTFISRLAVLRFTLGVNWNPARVLTLAQKLLWNGPQVAEVPTNMYNYTLLSKHSFLGVPCRRSIDVRSNNIGLRLTMHHFQPSLVLEPFNRYSYFWGLYKRTQTAVFLCLLRRHRRTRGRKRVSCVLRQLYIYIYSCYGRSTRAVVHERRDAAALQLAIVGKF